MGSFLYHASLKHLSQIMDIAAICAVHNVPHDPEWTSYVCCYLCIVLDVFAFKYKTRFNSMNVNRHQKNQNAETFSSLYFGIAALLMIISGFGIRQMDKIYCNPDSWFQLRLGCFLRV
eukprot:843429_1